MTTMTAYHGDPQLKTRTVAEMAAHRAADQLIAGTYWDPTEHKGCAVGCMTHHKDGGHAEWPERFLSAIPVGADLSRVYARFSVALMLDPEHGNITRAGGIPEVEAAVRRVGELWQNETTTLEQWSAAGRSAGSAAESAHYEWMADLLVRCLATAPTL